MLLIKREDAYIMKTEDVFVIVGGAKVDGIGMGVTEALAREGKLIITGANQGEVNKGAAHLKTQQIDAETLVCDVMKAEDMDNLVRAATSAGKIKGVAVITGLMPIVGDWKMLMNVNLLGVIVLVKMFSKVMEAGSSFVLFASNSPYQITRNLLDQSTNLLYEADSDPDFMEKIAPILCQYGEASACNLAYPISKRGVHLMARKYAVLLGARGIRVISVSPGLADTARARELLERDVKTETKNMWKQVNVYTPSKRMGTTREMGNVVRFLFSDDASFISGSDILIDGASTAGMRVSKAVEQF
jgi:NAD(P)-dependent dehydrogenase (short-subunit alcohol dehydrogenase family)